MKSSRESGRSAPAATSTSLRPTSSRTRRAFAVVFSSVWFPATVVTPRRSSSGLASASRSAIASSCPGSQSSRIGVGSLTRAQYLVNLRRRGQRGLSAGPGGCDRTGGAGAAKGLLPLAPFEERDDEAGREGVPGARPVDRLDFGRRGARNLFTVIQKQCTLGAQREGEKGSHGRRAECIQLERVRDDQVGAAEDITRDLPGGGRVEAEEAVEPIEGGLDRAVSDLQLADEGVRLSDLDAIRIEGMVGAGHDDDLGLPLLVDEDQRQPSRASNHLSAGQIDVRLAKLFHCEASEVVVSNRPDEPHIGAETRGGHRLVRALPAGDVVEARARDRLPRQGKVLDGGD